MVSDEIFEEGLMSMWNCGQSLMKIQTVLVFIARYLLYYFYSIPIDRGCISDSKNLNVRT